MKVTLTLLDPLPASLERWAADNFIDLEWIGDLYDGGLSETEIKAHYYRILARQEERI